MKVIITGSAGFIGYHVATALLEGGAEVVGVDNLSPYYDVDLKRARIARLEEKAGFEFRALDITDRVGMTRLTAAHDDATHVLHLAAQAGVRHSLTHPEDYIQTNLVGHFEVLEACRRLPDLAHLVYASSSSVYGRNTKLPYSESDPVDSPVSLYAATKKADELITHTYSHIHRLKATGLRFFTVYGPWGRPDMSALIFTRAILAGEPIDVFNYGNHRRDFTFVDDIVQGVVRSMDHGAQPNPDWDSDNPDPATSDAPYRIYNIGNNQPVELMKYIEVLEDCLGRKAEKNMLPLQPGDVPDTYADSQVLVDAVGYQPATPVEEGVARFVDWYVDYYNIKL